MSDAERAIRLRAQLPALRHGIYMNSGWAGPIAESTQAAMRAVAEREFARGRVGLWAASARDELANTAREAVARLLHADVDEVALTVSATDAMNVVLWGLDWTPGDEILTTNLENAAALVPMYILGARRGVEIRHVDLHYGEIDAARAIERALTPRTRLVLLSDVTYSTGALLDIRAIARASRARGVPVLVDGAQSGGAILRPMHDLEVDFYALSGHKWVGGPEGTGGLYVRRDAQKQLGLSYGGVYTDLDHGWGGALHPFPAARRHEVSTRNYPALAGQAAAIQWLCDEVGVEWAARRAHGLVEHAATAFRAIPGVEVVTPPNHAGLFAFSTPSPPRDLHVWLDQHQVWCRSVADPPSVRLSFGFYTTEDEIDRVAALVREHGRVTAGAA
jgi:selenocysteine lyase/cysteine desulfurase